MTNHTLNLLDDLLLTLRPALRKQDPDWYAADRNARALHDAFRTTCAEDHSLIRQVNDLLDAQGSAAEYESACYFRLGLQMGIELGGLDLLGE